MFYGIHRLFAYSQRNAFRRAMDPERLARFIDELLRWGKRIEVTLFLGRVEAPRSTVLRRIGGALKRATREFEVDGVDVLLCNARSRSVDVVLDVLSESVDPRSVVKALTACIFAKRPWSRLRNAAIDLAIGLGSGLSLAYGIARLIGVNPGGDLWTCLTVAMLAWGLAEFTRAFIYRRRGLKGFEDAWRAIEDSRPVKELTNLIAQIISELQSSVRNRFSTVIAARPTVYDVEAEKLELGAATMMKLRIVPRHVAEVAPPREPAVYRASLRD